MLKWREKRSYHSIIPSKVAMSNSFNVWQRRGNIEMPRSRSMENNFFCFVSIDSEPVSEKPGTY